MRTLENVIDILKVNTLIQFTDSSSSNDACQSCWNENRKLILYIPNCESVSDHDDYNTYYLSDLDGALIVESETLEDIIDYIRENC